MSNSHEVQENDAADHWIQCDRCSKWRRVPKAVADAISDDAEWYCEHNPNPLFSGCNVPQELTNEEIDQEAGEPEEDRNLPKLPAVWQLIRGNQYSHRKRKVQDEDDIMVCHCPPPWRGGDGCGPNCINRMLCIECTEDFCPCENQCNNQMFTRKQYAKLAVRRAGPKGFGLYAEEELAAGQFLIEYIGEVLEEEEYIRRKQYYIQTGQRHYYFMNIGNGEVIDACRKGNHARFINHSCEPNCETQKWMVRGELAIGLYTLRKIKAGEELTFDYNFERYGDKPMRCFCGSKKCRKFIGGTQESTANIVELGDAEDVTNDPEPVMVREEETDAMVQAMLDKEVGTTQRSWDTKLLTRLQQLCQQKGIDWSIAAEDAEGRTASTQQLPPGAASPSQQESEDGSHAAAPASMSAGLSHAQAAASPASSSAPVSEVARAQDGGVESPPPTVRGPLKAAFKQLKRKRGAAHDAQDDEAAAAAAAAKKLQAEQRKQLRLQQQEKRRLKQQQEFLRRQLEEERRLQKLHEKQLEQQRRQQELQERKQQQQRARQQQYEEEDEAEEEELPPQDSSTGDEDAVQEAAEMDERELEDSDANVEDTEGQQPAGALTDADLEDDMSDQDMPAKPPPAPVVHSRRIRIVQSHRRRPPLAPGAKAAAAAADSSKQQKGATTGTGRRSFLTLSVSSVGKQLKRRSEVDRRLEQLVQKQSFKLKEPGQQSVIKVLRMFNLCDITPRQTDPLVQQQLQQLQQPSSKQGSPTKRPPENGDAAQQLQLQRQASGGQQLEQQQQQQSDATGSILQQQEGAQDMQIDQQQQQEAGGSISEQGLPQLPQHLQPLRGAELEARERESEARFKARQRARMADLGMLLDVVLASSSEKLKKEWVSCGILTQLQQTLGRLPFTQEYSVVLVKVIRVLEHLPITPDDLYTIRSAHGTFADLIRRMASSASDWEVRRRSHQLLKRYAASTCSDATLLQLYHVPGPNNKPYLLGLHLPPAQVSRLLALLPKNAPPPHQGGRRGERQYQLQQQQQPYRGERGFPPGAMAPAAPMGGVEQQHSSPSTSHGAALVCEGPSGPQGPPGSPPGGQSSLPHWRAAALAAAGGAAEEVQYMQGNRPLGRGASSSQLASEGWETGPAPHGGPWGPGPPPPGHHLPPAGASGVFRHNRHGRHMQQRAPGGPFLPAHGGPPGRGPPLPGLAGPDGPPPPHRGGFGPDGMAGPGGSGDRGGGEQLPHAGGARGGPNGRAGPPYGPPDANGSWHPHGRFSASPGGFGPGAFDSHPRDREWGDRDREHDRDRDWDCDRDRERHRDWDRDREFGFLDGRPPTRYHGMPEPPAKRQRWDPPEPSGRQQQQQYSPGEPGQQQQQRMPPISDLWTDGTGVPPLDGWHSSGNIGRGGSGMRVMDLAEDAGQEPGSSNRGWQQRELQAGPFAVGRSKYGGWEPLPPAGPQQQQQQHGSEPPSYRPGPLPHQQRQLQRLQRQPPACIEELCSIGLYSYHQLGDDEAGAAAAAWLYPPASPRAAETAAQGSLSPIVAGRFSPPLDDIWVGGRRAPAQQLPPPGDGLAVEDLFCITQDAVLAGKTPGVAISTVLAASTAPGEPSPRQNPAAARQQQEHQPSSGKHHLQLPPQQQEPGCWPRAGAPDSYQQGPLQQPAPHLPPHKQQPGSKPVPAAALELPPGTRLLPPAQQQQQQMPHVWDQPGPEFEAYVCDAVKHRLGKYVQPDHPNRISKEDAQQLYRKLRREIVDKEITAFAERQASGTFKPIERAKLEVNIKEFVRLSIRRLHAARTGGPGGYSEGPSGVGVMAV